MKSTARSRPRRASRTRSCKPQSAVPDNPFGLWFPVSEDEVCPPFPVPDLSDEPLAPGLPDYRLVETLFVDSSGFGSRNEPALTGEEFADAVQADLRDGRRYGYGIIGHGQFQCHIGVYESASHPRFTRVSVRPEGNVAVLAPELRDVLKRRLLRELKKAHYDPSDQTCDICVAVSENLPVYAAEALASATECDEVEALLGQLASTNEERKAERTAFSTIPYTECTDCNSYTYEVNGDRPDVCRSCMSPISWEDDDLEDALKDLLEDE